MDGDRDVMSSGFVTAMEEQFPGLRDSGMLTFTQRDSSHRYGENLP
jgi:hypothetical protein